MSGIISLAYKPVPYTGIVASNCVPSFNLDSTNKQIMSRSYKYARTSITSLQIVVDNFSVSGTSTVTASVEYPAGTFTPILFSGLSSGSIANGSVIVSDSTNVTIPNGAQFWIRLYYTNANGIGWSQDKNTAQGDAANAGVSGIADQTLSGTISDTYSNGLMPVFAVIGQTIHPSVCIIGDSIAQGTGDTGNGGGGDQYGNVGIVERWVGPSFGFTNISVPAATASGVAGTNKYNPVFQYCTTAIVQIGRNDIYNGGDTAAQLEVSLNTIYGKLSGVRKIYQGNLIPTTTSSDSWATLVGQTIVTGETARVTFNSDLSGGSFGPNGGYIDFDSIVGNSTNNSLWRVDGTANKWTADGIHGSTFAYQSVASSPLVPLNGII